ncbi:MAG TPA: right-handed parallel beta-helix repeat-containing protein [Phycisphaerae bacterium]|nr:right-handed parallel beta-helix repeat-containing protein [Phycisphaerae bacterium]
MKLPACVAILAALMACGCPELGLPDGGPFPLPDGGTDTIGINPIEPAGEPVPEIGEPVSLAIINESGIAAGVRARFLVGEVEVRQTILQVPPGRAMDTIGPDLATRVEVQGRFVTGDPTPTVIWVLGHDFQGGGLLRYVLVGPGEEEDECPDDPDKTEAGVCGCGVPDTDSDGDDSADCVDGCPDDPDKTSPGVCGCGTPDEDANNNGKIDCEEEAQPQPTDRDRDGVPDSRDNCPTIPNTDQADYDEDGVGDVCDNCIEGGNGDQMDSDGDRLGDLCDPCPHDELNDADNDELCADEDPCPNDPDNDVDGDGVCGGVDQCPNTTPGMTVDEVGCPTPPVRPDLDRDGDVDQYDFSLFQKCFSGDGLPQNDPACSGALLDGDDDVDEVDALLFNRCYSGSNVPADPACRDCNGNGQDDREDLLGCPQGDPDCADCNADGLPDWCDIAEEISQDQNENDTPDECDPRACCLSGGDCQMLTPTLCEEAEGQSQNLDVDCASAECLQATEACCMPDSGLCYDLTVADCLAQYGTPQGLGSTCQTAMCYTPPMFEACCLPDGQCLETDVYACYSMGGVPQGPGSFCEPGLCTQGGLPAGVLVVKWDAPPGGDGESWETAFQSLQSALAKAGGAYQPTVIGAQAWNEIWVARGTYKPDDGSGERDLGFALLPGVQVYGGFAGNETQREQRNIEEYPTILSGDIGQVDNDQDNSFNVVTAGEGVDGMDALDGFIIEKGHASGREAPDCGGGVLISGGSPGLNNLVIRSNMAAFAGGGMCIQGGSPRLYRCAFESNWAGIQGGGLYADGSLVSLEGCRFGYNATTGQGGALCAHYCSSVLSRCDFVMNEAMQQGGAVVNDGSSLHMANCRFVGNSTTAAGSTGGAIYSAGDYPLLEMMSCLLNGNSAGVGGGIHQNALGVAILVNCTLHRNASLLPEAGGGGIYNEMGDVEATNCIFWDNLGDSGLPSMDAIETTIGRISTVTYSCVPGALGQTPTNTDMNPQFADADGPDNIPGNRDDNLTPTAGVPIAEGGDVAAILDDFGDLDFDLDVSEPTPLDLADHARILGGGVDMGVFEQIPN